MWQRSEGEVVNIGGSVIGATGTVGAVIAATGCTIVAAAGSAVVTTPGTGVAAALVAVATPVSAGVVHLITPSAQHLHFGDVDVQRETGSAVASIVLPRSEPALDVDLLTAGEVLVTNVGETPESGAVEPLSFLALFAGTQWYNDDCLR